MLVISNNGEITENDINDETTENDITEKLLRSKLNTMFIVIIIHPFFASLHAKKSTNRRFMLLSFKHFLNNW